MSETVSLKRPSVPWDEEHVKFLLSEPESLLREEPWSSWIRQQGGLTAVYAMLRNLPSLSERQRKTLNALLSEPGASLQKYAFMLHVSVATYVRYRTSLIKTLVTMLNARLLDRQPQHEARKVVAFPSNNLPYQHLPLIGRDRELKAVRDLLLKDGVSLLTITGPGGIGKTRLALQAANDSLGDFEDGVYFVPLAAITNPDLVAATVVQSLGFKPGENKPALEMLKDFLRERQILLVLDNFEQVTTAAPLLGEILAAAPDLKILVTSRAVLHLYGEHEYVVPPLAFPDLNNLPPLDELARSPAVALFINRARAVKADFRLTEENALVVAEICARLEGIPLALELAAARIKLFSPRALLRELSNRLTLLSQKNVRLTPRHQTLHNAISWSYQILDPEEQALFAQLGVFVGGCTLEAVEAVCTWRTKSGIPMLEQLARLVDKSMLQHEMREDGEPRFMLLEILRAYALEQLEAGSQIVATRQRHMAYYRDLVQAIEPGPKQPDLPSWMRRLEEEHDNLRAALQWALENEDNESALAIAGAVWRFWQIHGHVEEGLAWMKTVLERSRSEKTLARAKALWGAGWLSMVMGSLEQSQEYFEEGMAIARQLEDKRYMGLALHGVGAVARGQGDFERALVAFEESLPLFQELGSAEDIAWTFEHLGATVIERGEYSQAISYLTQGLALFRELGQRWPCAEALMFIGHASLQQGNYELAEQRYGEALAIYEELEDRLNIVTMRSYIGATLFGRGERQRAIGIYKETLVMAHEMKDYWGLAWGLERLAEAAEKLDQPERAACLWGAADALRKVSGVLWHPGFRSNYTEERFRALITRLGEGEWNRLWAEGRSLSLDEAVACALEV